MIEQQGKSPVTREFLILTIEGKRLLPKKIVSSARETFQCKTLILAKIKSEKEGKKTLDYLIGLHTRDASKKNYKRKSRNMFPEMKIKNVDASAKKGLGAWARALCAEDFEILSCSGELETLKLIRIAQQSKNKKPLATSPKKGEGG